MRIECTIGLIALACACSGPQTKPAAAVKSNAAIAVEVSQTTAFAGGFADDLAARLRQGLLESGSGVPVTDAAKADLVLKVNILKANFTNAVQWEWQLVAPKSGAIVASKTDSAAAGRNAGPLANDIMGAVAGLDLTPYQGGQTAIAAAVAAPTTSAFPTSATDGTNSWAVIIGVEKYREALPEATGARADAEAFAKMVQTTLNVPPNNVKLLVGERASRSDISGALTEWLPRNAVKPGGRVYVFFSGHGAPDVESGEAYLLPYDADPAYIKSGGFQVGELQKSLAKLENQQVYVFLDACFSGVGDRTVLAAGTRPVVPVRDVAPVSGVVTFAAAGGTQTTGAAPSGTHGLFSYFLLNGMRGAADTNGDATITVGELGNYVRAEVTTEARRQNREQTPTIAGPDNAQVISGLSH